MRGPHQKGYFKRNGTMRGAFYCAFTEMGQRGFLFIMPLQTPTFCEIKFFVIPTPFLPIPFCCQHFLSAACVLHALQMFHCTQRTWQSLCYLIFSRDKFIGIHWTPLIVCVAVFHHKNVGNQNTRRFWNPSVWFKTLLCRTAMAELHFDYSSG